MVSEGRVIAYVLPHNNGVPLESKIVELNKENGFKFKDLASDVMRWQNQT